MAADNKLLGQFDLVGIPPSPRGMPQIEVTFDIDANGIVNVSAKDKATGKEQQIRIQASGGLSDSDIEEMVQDAEAHADDDKERKELVEVRNQADSLIHSTEKNLSEYGDKVSEDERGEIESAISSLKDVFANEEAKPEELKEKSDALMAASMKLGEAMYKASQEGADDMPGGGDPSNNNGEQSTTPSDETIVDAEFEEVDSEDKEDKKKDS